jgi:hypothetical protein
MKQDLSPPVIFQMLTSQFGIVQIPVKTIISHMNLPSVPIIVSPFAGGKMILLFHVEDIGFVKTAGVRPVGMMVDISISNMEV